MSFWPGCWSDSGPATELHTVSGKKKHTEAIRRHDSHEDDESAPSLVLSDLGVCCYVYVFLQLWATVAAALHVVSTLLVRKGAQLDYNFHSLLQLRYVWECVGKRNKSWFRLNNFHKEDKSSTSVWKSRVRAIHPPKIIHPSAFFWLLIVVRTLDSYCCQTKTAIISKTTKVSPLSVTDMPQNDCAHCDRLRKEKMSST